MTPNTIAIVGMSGSGKSIAAEYLEEKGYTSIRFGSVVDEAIAQAGLPWTPENNVVFRKKVREEGMNAIAIRLYPKILETQAKNPRVLLDGLYSWEEYTYLSEKIPHLVLLCIYARPEIRYQRLSTRKERPFTKEEARRRDITEIEDVNKGGPIAIADYLIENEGSIEEYQKKIDNFLLWQQK